MKDYILVRKSQIFHYEKTPLFTKTEKGDFVLYKSEDLKVDPKRFLIDGSPQLYAPQQARDLASEEVRKHLNEMLVKTIKSGDLKATKAAMYDIVDDAFQEPLEENLHVLPDTLDILYEGYSNTTKLLKSIGDLRFGGSTLVEHSVNAMVLVFNYCVFNGFSENDTKKLSLTSLLHDVGLTRLPLSLTGANRKLTDTEFEEYKKHAILGYEVIRESMDMDPSIAKGVLEHHERPDGSGYPHGIANISFAGSLIGMADSFESLTNTEKEHRRKKDPFGALKIIQDEILKHDRFDRVIFKNFCLSLKGKSSYIF